MRRLLLLVATLALPLQVNAQSQPAAAPSNALARSLTSFGRPYGTWLIMAFDSIPERKYAFKPTPVQQSIGYIAQHLEGANYGLCELFGDAKRTLTAKDSMADTIKARWPKDTLTARLRQSFAFCTEAMSKLTDAALSDTLMAGEGANRQKVLRARYVQLFVTDVAEHYSQIATYMRIMGLVPPSALPLFNR